MSFCKIIPNHILARIFAPPCLLLFTINYSIHVFMLIFYTIIQLNTAGKAESLHVYVYVYTVCKYSYVNNIVSLPIILFGVLTC